MTKVPKVEGATMLCYQCKVTLYCHMTEYDDRANKLQWQNPDGTAHYLPPGPDGSFPKEHNRPLTADSSGLNPNEPLPIGDDIQFTVNTDNPGRVLELPNVQAEYKDQTNKKLDEIISALSILTGATQEILRIVAEMKLAGEPEDLGEIAEIDEN